MASDNKWAIILAGGGGQRLWPLSRKSRPKHLIPVNKKITLLNIAIDRVNTLVGYKNIVIVTKKEQTGLIKKCVKNKNITILSEPVGKNTFPAISIGVKYVLNQDKDAVISVFPADHLITPVSKFKKYLSKSYSLISKDPSNIILWGVKPDFPSTDFGYINVSNKLKTGFNNIKNFVEKPDINKAVKYVKSKKYFFNCGIFVFNGKIYIDTLRSVSLKDYLLLNKVYKNRNSKTPDRNIYKKFPSISIDYHIIEKIKNKICLPVDFNWSDIGSLREFIHKFQNAKPITLNSKNILSYSESNINIFAYGVNDLVIAESNGNILISSMEYSNKIREFYNIISKKYPEII